MIKDRNRKVQRKISIIIATDFLCWVPFVIVCCLHTLAVLDATPWYAFFSILVLPINSVINPLLYDSKITDSIGRARAKIQSSECYKEMVKFIDETKDKVYSSDSFQSMIKFINKTKTRIKSSKYIETVVKSINEFKTKITRCRTKIIGFFEPNKNAELNAPSELNEMQDLGT